METDGGEEEAELSLAHHLQGPGLRRFTLIKTACDLYQPVGLAMKQTGGSDVRAASRCTNSAQRDQNRRTVGRQEPMLNLD